MMSNRTIVVLLGLAVLAAGCGGGAGGQDTPKAAMKKFQASILENDKDDFLEVVAYPEEHEEVVGALFDTIAGAARVQQKVATIYGEDAVAQFNEAGQGNMKASTSHIPTGDDWAGGLTYDVKDDTATVTDPSRPGEEAIELTRKGDAWYIDFNALGDEMPEGEAKDMALRMFAAMGKALDETADEIEEGMSLEEAKATMQQNMQEALKPIMAEMMQKAMQGDR